MISPSRNRMRTHRPSILGRVWNTIRSGGASVTLPESSTRLTVEREAWELLLADHLRDVRLDVGVGRDAFFVAVVPFAVASMLRRVPWTRRLKESRP